MSGAPDFGNLAGSAGLASGQFGGETPAAENQLSPAAADEQKDSAVEVVEPAPAAEEVETPAPTVLQQGEPAAPADVGGQPEADGGAFVERASGPSALVARLSRATQNAGAFADSTPAPFGKASSNTAGRTTTTASIKGRDLSRQSIALTQAGLIEDPAIGGRVSARLGVDLRDAGKLSARLAAAAEGTNDQIANMYDDMAAVGRGPGGARPEGSAPGRPSTRPGTTKSSMAQVMGAVPTYRASGLDQVTNNENLGRNVKNVNEVRFDQAELTHAHAFVDAVGSLPENRLPMAGGGAHSLLGPNLPLKALPRHNFASIAAGNLNSQAAQKKAQWMADHVARQSFLKRDFFHTKADLYETGLQIILDKKLIEPAVGLRAEAQLQAVDQGMRVFQMLHDAYKLRAFQAWKDETFIRRLYYLRPLAMAQENGCRRALLQLAFTAWLVWYDPLERQDAKQKRLADEYMLSEKPGMDAATDDADIAVGNLAPTDAVAATNYLQNEGRVLEQIPVSPVGPDRGQAHVEALIAPTAHVEALIAPAAPRAESGDSNQRSKKLSTVREPSQTVVQQRPEEVDLPQVDVDNFNQNLPPADRISDRAQITNYIDVQPAAPRAPQQLSRGGGVSQVVSINPVLAQDVLPPKTGPRKNLITPAGWIKPARATIEEPGAIVKYGGPRTGTPRAQDDPRGYMQEQKTPKIMTHRGYDVIADERAVKDSPYVISHEVHRHPHIHRYLESKVRTESRRSVAPGDGNAGRATAGGAPRGSAGEAAAPAEAEPPRVSGLAEAAPRGSAAEAAPRGSAAEAAPRGSAAEAAPRGSAAEAAPRGSAAEAAPRGSAAEAAPRISAAEAAPRGSAAEAAPRGSATGVDAGAGEAQPQDAAAGAVPEGETIGYGESDESGWETEVSSRSSGGMFERGHFLPPSRGLKMMANRLPNGNASHLQVAAPVNDRQCGAEGSVVAPVTSAKASVRASFMRFRK